MLDLEWDDEMAINEHTPLSVSCTVHLCIPDDQSRHLPKRRRAPATLPSGVPLPRVGEVIYLSRSSAWGVSLIVHEWANATTLRVEVWLQHVTTNGHSRPSGFSLTQ